MEPTEPASPPPGMASNEAMASQPMPQGNFLNLEAAGHAQSSGSAVLLLIPASEHLLAHARQLAADGSHQFAVVFAHASCELHTEGELNPFLEGVL